MALRTWVIIILVILVLGLWFYAETTKDIVKAVGGVTASIGKKTVDKVQSIEKPIINDNKAEEDNN